MLVAEYLHTLLAGFLRRELKEFRRSPDYLRRRKAGTRAAARRAFQEGMVRRLTRRLNDLWWRRIDTGGNGHAVIIQEKQHLAQLEKDMERRGLVLADLGSLKRADRRFDGHLVAGYRAAGNVAIDPSVGDAGSVARLPSR